MSNNDNREFWTMGRYAFDEGDIGLAKDSRDRFNWGFRFGGFMPVANLINFEAEPCGPMAFSVKLWYNTKTKRGVCYMHPRFIYSGNIVEMKEAGIKLDEFTPISLQEYLSRITSLLEEMHENIGKSNVSRDGMIFDFSVECDNKILHREYNDEDGAVKFIYHFDNNNELIDSMTIEPVADTIDEDPIAYAFVTDKSGRTTKYGLTLVQVLE